MSQELEPPGPPSTWSASVLKAMSAQVEEDIKTMEVTKEENGRKVEGLQARLRDANAKLSNTPNMLTSIDPTVNPFAKTISNDAWVKGTALEDLV